MIMVSATVKQRLPRTSVPGTARDHNTPGKIPEARPAESRQPTPSGGTPSVGPLVSARGCRHRANHSTRLMADLYLLGKQRDNRHLRAWDQRLQASPHRQGRRGLPPAFQIPVSPRTPVKDSGRCIVQDFAELFFANDALERFQILGCPISHDMGEKMHRIDKGFPRLFIPDNPTGHIQQFRCGR